VLHANNESWNTNDVMYGDKHNIEKKGCKNETNTSNKPKQRMICKRNYMCPAKPKIFTIWPLPKKSGNTKHNTCIIVSGP